MQLKSKAEVETAISQVAGFSSAASASIADGVMACCAPLEAYGDFAAIPFLVLLEIAFQVAEIVFGEGGITLDKIKSVIEMLKAILGT
jgi:hypothetical protein